MPPPFRFIRCVYPIIYNTQGQEVCQGDVRGFSQKAADGPARSIRRCCCSYSLGIPLGSFSGATANRYAHRLNAVTDSSLYVIQ